MFEIRKTKTFDAAHWLPNHGGQCSNMHGHTWMVTVCIRGEVHGPDSELESERGMVTDFARLSHQMNHIIAELDHSVINDRVKNPTAELIAKYIFDRMHRQGPSWVEVAETPNNVARYYAP